MATIQAKGFEAYIAKLDMLASQSEETMKRTIWPAAGIVAAAIQAGANSVPVDDEYRPPGEMQYGIRSEEKELLVSGVGIARHENSGVSVHTHVGFNKDAASVARKIEQGRSYLQKYPFVRRAVNSSRAAAQAAMEAQFHEELNKIMN